MANRGQDHPLLGADSHLLRGDRAEHRFLGPLSLTFWRVVLRFMHMKRRHLKRKHGHAEGRRGKAWL